MNDFDPKTRIMVLALYVLTGVLTQEQLTKMIEDNAPVPEKWEDIIVFINELKAKS